MRKAVLVGIIACLLGVGTLVSAEDMRIGFVDLRRVKDTNQWKQLEEIFQAEVMKSQIEVEQRKQQLEASALEYERQRSMLSPDAQRDKENELKKQQLDFQLWAQDRQKALEAKRNQMSQLIWSRVDDVIKRIAKERELTLVIDYDPNPSDITANLEKGFAYLAPELDITDEVIKAFEAEVLSEENM